MGDQLNQADAVYQKGQQCDNGNNQQELNGCVVATSFAWGSSCREEKVRATVL
ncbi:MULTISPECIES: hypothetical protein [Enterobacteriaceae]|uniref:hypothetical protein n=1 Tax=Enterobacteriaceae TaxID=543 RepID=UPI0015E7C55A|nr:MULTISPECIES: hypothetical protein [Enterobacteriaceae]HAT3918525.1 hypothetical protein [Kluyvera ascorbata]HAT3943438.1 hypothetical protein [Kluyvera ascorbata]HAT3948684.1 hypothetical protein [Kluyvera ascorbata]HAT3956435.1 hypothetical protein [Kluyvera ascorbata]